MMFNSTLLISDIEADREAWLNARRGKITATKIGIIAGLSRYKSELELWAEDTGKVPEQEANDDIGFLEFGRTNEPLVRKLTAKKLGKQLIAANALYQHKTLDWALASPDAYTPEGDFLAELKTATAKSDGLWSDEHAPEIYQVQLCWQMGVLDGPRDGCLSCMIGGDPRDIRTPRFKFDPQEFETLVTIAEAYRERVERDIPPDPGPGDSKLIQNIYAKRQAATLHLAGPDAVEVENIVLELRTLKAAKAQAEEGARLLKDEVSKLENKIRIKLAGHEIAILPGGGEIRVKAVEVKPFMNPGYSYSRVTLPRQK